MYGPEVEEIEQILFDKIKKLDDLLNSVRNALIKAYIIREKSYKLMEYIDDNLNATYPSIDPKTGLGIEGCGLEPWDHREYIYDCDIVHKYEDLYKKYENKLDIAMQDQLFFTLNFIILHY